MKKIYEDEVELKKDLDNLGIRYGDRMNTSYQFIIYLWDNKGNSIISRNIYNSPISAIRAVPGILEKIKLPIDDLDIELKAVFDEKTDEIFVCNCNLSPYIYFKKQEVNIENKEE